MAAQRFSPPAPWQRGVRMITLGATLTAACIESPAGPQAARRTGEVAQASVAPAPSHGFNDDIAWVGLEDGLAESARLGRPMLLLVHASWCPRCKELRAPFQDPKLVELSQQFVMVNLDQDKVPRSLEFAPDGNYVPRVLFVAPQTGRPDADLRNPRRTGTVYFYTPQDDLLGTMQKALSRYGAS